ncbi:MAG: hypothetical protein ABR581_05110, partial [Thermoleophilaceae bacterium]
MSGDVIHKGEYGNRVLACGQSGQDWMDKWDDPEFPVTCSACLATRTPAVKVGDIVRDPALLVDGMLVEWAAPVDWTPDGGSWSEEAWPLRHPTWSPSGLRRVRESGVRVLALPVRVGCRLPTLDEAMAP